MPDGTADNPYGDNRPSPYGTKKVTIAGVTFDASKDPDVEARGRAAIAQLDAPYKKQSSDHQNKY